MLWVLKRTVSMKKVNKQCLLDTPVIFGGDFGKLPFPTHLGKYFIKIGKISAKIHEIGKIKAIFLIGNDSKNGQIKSLYPPHSKGP